MTHPSTTTLLLSPPHPFAPLPSQAARAEEIQVELDKSNSAIEGLSSEKKKLEEDLVRSPDTSRRRCMAYAALPTELRSHS